MTKFQIGQKVRVISWDARLGEENGSTTVLAEVFGVSRFGHVIVDDRSYLETSDGKWIAQHGAGQKRNVMSRIEPA